MARDKKKFGKSLIEQYALVADGQTEQWYIKQFMEYYNISIKITPELPKSKTLKEQYKLIELFIKNNSYDKIIWIIDLDTILKENKNPKNYGKSLAEFKNFYNNAISNFKWEQKVIVIINNPCLEYWYCMHKNPEMNTFFDSYDKMLPTLQNYKIDKQLFEKYYKNKNDDYSSGIGLFKKLLPDLKKLFSSKLNKSNKIDFSKFKTFNIENCQNEGCSQMWKIFEVFNIDPTK